MKEEYNCEGHRAWVVWISLIAVILMGVGIFFYYTFLRQTPAALIQVVPNDAVFLFEVNDHDDFVQTTYKGIQPCLNELFAMDVLPAFETVSGKMAASEELPLIISGHASEKGLSLLFNARADKHAFRKLLRSLSIDPANYTSYEQYKIYTYGTNYKSLKFVYFNHVLSVSDNVELLKKALMQHTHPKNLLSDKSFRKLIEVAVKNQKQNWLFVHNPVYFEFLSTWFNESVTSVLGKLKTLSEWSGYQLRISQNEVFLSGYATVDNPKLVDLAGRKSVTEYPDERMPFNTIWYYREAMPDYAAHRFAMLNDSNAICRFLLVPHDTLGKAYNPFEGSAWTDSMRLAYPTGIYPVTEDIQMPDATIFGTDVYRCFIDRDGYYVFAPSMEAMAWYLRDLSRNGALASNRYYMFASTNTASDNLLEFDYFNSSSQRPLFQLMSDKGKTSFVGQHLRVFSITCNAVDDGLASVNLYLGL